MEISKKVFAVLKKAPYDIILFYIFSTLVVVFSWYLRLDSNKALRETLIPYTGWGFGNAYQFGIFFIPLCLFSFGGNVTKTINLLRFYIMITMLIECYNGYQDWLSISPEDYTNHNPYLRYDSLTPVYTIFTPLFWTLLMAWTLSWNYFKRKKKNNLNPETES
jgi:hypothetical protein